MGLIGGGSKHMCFGKLFAKYSVMKKLLFLFTLVCAFSCSESEEEKQKADVYQIRSIGQLSTTEFTLGKIIELHDDKAWYKFGDRNILISCKATVKAGIDLQKIRKGDIEIKGDDVKITLPYPEILSFDMNPESLKTEMQDINGFRADFTQEEKNGIIAEGEKSIRESLKETSIVQEARNNAELFVQEFYQELGYRNVEIEFRKPYTEEIKAR